VTHICMYVYLQFTSRARLLVLEFYCRDTKSWFQFVAFNLSDSRKRESHAIQRLSLARVAQIECNKMLSPKSYLADVFCHVANHKHGHHNQMSHATLESHSRDSR